MTRFQEAYAKLLQQQLNGAAGMRLEMLKKHGAGEKKLLELLWSVFRSFDGFILEYEFVTSTGVRNYIDVYYEPLRIAFEAEGYVVHAEKITRDRFDSERNKIRSIAINGSIYYPFTWDEMSKRPEMCRKSIYELLGQLSMNGVHLDQELSRHEREIIRHGILGGGSLTFSEMCKCLEANAHFTRKIIQSLIHKRILRPERPEARRRHRYMLEEDAYRILR